MTDMRRESDSLGVVEVPADRLWGAQPSARSSISASAGISFAGEMSRPMRLEESRRHCEPRQQRLDDQRYWLIVSDLR